MQPSGSTAPEGPSPGLWPQLAPYVVPPTAAAAAIVLPFRDLIGKSALQLELPKPHTTWIQGVKSGLSAAPTVGMIVGGQMILQNVVEQVLLTDGAKPDLSTKFASAAIVGAVSSPILAIFNGQTLGWGWRESLRKLSAKQCFAITLQETTFVGGICAGEVLAEAMKSQMGSQDDSPHLHKGVEYLAAFTAGAAGSVFGHPGNTALTRWQNGLTVDSARQSMLGAATKARAIGCFAVLYKIGKDILNYTV